MAFPVELAPDILAIAEELKLRPEDVEEQFVRGGGPGGQKINKTASAVQLVHHVSGIEVKVQKHREQSKNRQSAWKLLILKLEEKEKGEASRLQREIFKLRKQKQKRTKRSKEKMLDDKARHSDIKEKRRDAWESWREGI